MTRTESAATITRVLRSLGLRNRGRDKDFGVHGQYRRGERIATIVHFYGFEADRIVAEHAEEIERLTREAGYPFRVTVYTASSGRPIVSVHN